MLVRISRMLKATINSTNVNPACPLRAHSLKLRNLKGAKILIQGVPAKAAAAAMAVAEAVFLGSPKGQGKKVLAARHSPESLPAQESYPVLATMAKSTTAELPSGPHSQAHWQARSPASG